MTPLVSDKYRYILFYNPKSACSVARQIFIELHRTELSTEHQAKLSALRELNQDDWHDIHRLFPMRSNVDYSGYFKFALVRHPLMRFVSAYLNRIVMHQADFDLIRNFYALRNGADYEPSFSFNEFVDYVAESKPGDMINRHFLNQSQTFTPIANHELFTPNQPLFDRLKTQFSKLRHGLPSNVTELNLVCQVEAMTKGFTSAYKNIFQHDPDMQQKALTILNNLPLHNVTFTREQLQDDAASLSAEELRNLGKMPSYSSFLTPQTTFKLQKYYSDDLYNFGYSALPDKSIDKFEAQIKATVRSMVPDDFDWNHYLASNADLRANGINNKTSAISHWIHHGRFEDRVYRK